jgi:hypothetical protein
MTRAPWTLVNNTLHRAPLREPVEGTRHPRVCGRWRTPIPPLRRGIRTFVWRATPTKGQERPTTL